MADWWVSLRSLWAGWWEWVIAILLALAAAVALWLAPDNQLIEAPGAPVASVTVNPAAVMVVVGATAALAATVKDVNGNVLTNRATTWSSTPEASVSTLGVVTGVTVGTATITAISEGKSGTATVNVVAAETAIQDEIKVAFSASTPQQTWVLLRGQTAATCEKALPKTGSVADFFVANMWTTATCPSEVAVFDSGYAPVIHAGAFTVNSDVITETPVSPLPLDINLWITADATAPGFFEKLKTILVETQALLDSNRVGVELRLPWSDGTWHGLGSWQNPTARVVATTGAATKIGTSCDVSTVRTDASLYDASRLNLYVIEEFWNSDASQALPGTYEDLCPVEAGQPRNVMYFSWSHNVYASLAHVLGHALSLIKTTPGINMTMQVGHTGTISTSTPPTCPNQMTLPAHPGRVYCVWIAGFTPTNIMWTGLAPDVDDPQRTFSLGQVYRMAFDSLSWLYKGGIRGAGALKRDCPRDAPASTDPCPPLALGW